MEYAKLKYSASTTCHADHIFVTQKAILKVGHCRRRHHCRQVVEALYFSLAYSMIEMSGLNVTPAMGAQIPEEVALHLVLQARSSLMTGAVTVVVSVPLSTKVPVQARRADALAAQKALACVVQSAGD